MVGIRRRAEPGIGPYSAIAVKAAAGFDDCPTLTSIQMTSRQGSLGRDKLPDYRAVPSLEDILVVSSSEPRIEHFRREQAGWRIHDLRGQDTLRLETSTSPSISATYAPVS